MSEAIQTNGADPPPLGPALRICTDDWPEPDRVAIFREVYGRETLRVDMEPLSEAPLRIDITVRKLAGLGLVSGWRSALRTGRSKALLSDGDDGFVVGVADCRSIAQQLGREAVLEPGTACAFSNADPGNLTFPESGRLTSLVLPRNALGALLRNADDCIARPVPRSTPALRLLIGYLEVLKDDALFANEELQQLAVAHVYDLLALALGATRDAVALAKGRGLRAARLHVIKKDIASRLDDDLSFDKLAARHRLSPRYVRLLFEAEGTTFTEFVRDQRLLRAHRMLASRRFDHRRIGEIAYDVGFNDLSYFNRLFRRRFGMSPSDARKGAKRVNEADSTF